MVRAHRSGRPQPGRHSTRLTRRGGAAQGDDGELKFLPVVSERARTNLNRIAARKTR
ncbi:hypothetical protein ACFYWN_40775 [Streptomyces sp. NPDC002917]|uniref:hypothetical protein n=1 Tax=unclassified Streptomyces TaxID=2593676 RepID=UPI0033BD8462|nr:hypothetical protein OG955_03105 [Streptomyces sp. NBC_01602]